MIKKYYQSLNSLAFGPAMTLNVFAIFLCKFISDRKGIMWLRTVMIVLTVILAITMFFYYKRKLRISRTLKDVKDLDAYEKGGVIDRSWILDDRILACTAVNIHEISAYGIKEMKVEEGAHGLLNIVLYNENEIVPMSCRDKAEARRFAGFIQKRNPEVKLTGITAEGNGTLQELGA